MGVHRYAIATAVATFTLLIFGGLVSTTESGLACPDWPLCEGKFIPKMVDGKEYEHTHRLVASFVGAMTFGLTALLFKHRRKDRLLTRLGALAAVGVTVQALLGALTVKMKLPWWVSSTHLAVAMAFFCLAVTLAFLTRQRLGPGATADRRLGKAVLPVVGLVYAQVVVGGLMRHLRGGLVCGYEVLTCQGQVWPLEGHAGIHLHMAHRLLGVVAALAVLAMAVWLWRQQSTSPVARWLSAGLAVLVVVQVGLGIATILTSRELVTMTVHSSVGAALLGGLVSLFWSVRPVRPLADPAPSAATDAQASLEPA